MMTKLAEWKNKYGMQLWKGIVVLLFPTILCGVFCAIRGTALSEMYAPDSFNNDSFFYFKMVQGVIENGFPKGYFGFDESRALVGSFGVWSPLILTPWAIWGMLFGWGYASAFACNIAFFSVALLVFVLLSRMEWKGICSMICMLSLIPSLPLHLLSCLPEANLLSFVVLFLGLAVGIQYTGRKQLYLAWMAVICIFLTIIRPFMIILTVIPCYYLWKEKRKRGILYSLVLIGMCGGLYLLGSHYFSAPYFFEILNFSFFQYLLQGQWYAAYRFLKECVKDIIPTILWFMKEAFDYGLTAGTHYVIAVLTTVISLYHLFFDKKSNHKIIHFMLVMMNAAIVSSILLVYRQVNEGGRHIFLFAIAGCMIACLESGKISYTARGICVVIFMVIIGRGAMVPTDYDIPIQKEYTKNIITYWENAFQEKNFEMSDGIGYENTLIWCLGASYNELYGTPPGIGVSCCSEWYLTNHFSEIKCRFIAIPSGSTLDIMCNEAGYEEIGRSAQMVIYERFRLSNEAK